MTESERGVDAAAELLRRAGELDATERLRARAAFLGRLDRERARPVSASFGHWRYGGPLALAAGVALVWLLVLWNPEQGLGYTVEGATSEGGYVRAAQHRPARITFSDRSEIRVSEGARLRIEPHAAQGGAHVAVEGGRLDVVVAHTERSNWRFSAGPFQVRVTGTRFTLAWDGNQSKIEVTLKEGSVEIEGYAGSGAVSVRAGQRFIGDAKRRTMLVTDVEPPPEAGEPRPSPEAEARPSSADEASSEAPPELPDRPALVPSPSAIPPAAGSRPKLGWSKLVSEGEFQRVVDQAAARGLPACLAGCAAEDLSALADAARYVGRGDLAEKALLALRARHAGTHGSRAAFLLGRVHENRGDADGAKRWYETSLREGPSGAFAAEALAGKMRAVKLVDGPAAARATAREYLRLYPKGVHATMARQLSGDP